MVINITKLGRDYQIGFLDVLCLQFLAEKHTVPQEIQKIQLDDKTNY
jgi:hypothetical protein